MKKQWKAGAYLRLSRDDEGFVSESSSIKNQKVMILDYLSELTDIELVDVYTDDGYTGTNFNRPGFQEMMSDIDFGRINCVIVKDLSRLGRNTTKVGIIKDEVFPSKGVRFIAINDNVDTKGGIDDNDVTDFKLVFNEYYVRDISKKIRSSLRASAKEGLFVGSYAPFGYKKSKEDKHKLVVDEEAADIVRKIFVDYSQGKSGREIANELNSKGVLSPLAYRNKQLGKESKKYAWTSNTVFQLLKNEVYVGNMVQHKRENISYKLSQRKFVDAAEQIVVKGTHTPIIDEHLKMEVNMMLNKKNETRIRKRTNGELVPIIFSGLLICSDCGGVLAATMKHDKRCYRCSLYSNAGKNACSSHYIKEDELLKGVLSEINILINEYESNPTDFIRKVKNAVFNNKLQEVNNAKLDMVDLKRQVKEIEDTMVQLYDDKINNVINQQMFSMMSSNYSNKLEKLLQSIDDCDKILKKENMSSSKIDNWINALLSMKNCKVPTKHDLSMIIEKIYINSVDIEKRFIIKWKIGNLDNIDFSKLKKSA